MGGYYSIFPAVQQKQIEPPKENTIERSSNDKLNEYKLEIARKHEKRRQILTEKKQEMDDLRKRVAELTEENAKLKEMNDGSAKIDGSAEIDRSTEIDKSAEIDRLQRENDDLRKTVQDGKFEELVVKNREFRVQIAEMQGELQNLNSEAVNFEKERQDYHTHVTALKDVIKVSKHMLQIREAQLKELKEKVDNIEKTLASREMNLLSQDLRSEYERQLENIRNLKVLYEERQQADKQEKDSLMSQLEEVNKELSDVKKSAQELDERVTELNEENSKKYDSIKALESDLGLSQAECREYQAELTVINQLFSEILLGFNNTQDIDLDKLKVILEENHGLLQKIVVNEISKEVSSALPKVLLDLVYQVKEKENVEEQDGKATNSIHQLNSVEEIVENLPKVWKILIELLSHQKNPPNEVFGNPENPCYKVVETPKGPNLVLSVSQTFIRLKNLILEKKALEKETNNLKQLNTHLESRLQDQEKRLETVTCELSETWHVVGKLQKQHQLLHTQEKILRYELAQKRKLLGELREELEYSREKCLQAREKNTTTEREWKKLRHEFASRRLATKEEANNSCESGYSDDRECSSDEDVEPGYETDVSLDCSSELKTEEKKTECTNVDEPEPEQQQQPSTSDGPKKTLEEVLAARDERLKRLEHEALQLVTKVTNTNNRSVDISNKLENLHEVYGESSSSTDQPDENVDGNSSGNIDNNQE